MVDRTKVDKSVLVLSEPLSVHKSKAFTFDRFILVAQFIHCSLKQNLGVICSLLSALSFTGVDILIYDVGQKQHPAQALLLNCTVMLILNMGILIVVRPTIPRDSREMLFLILSGFLCGSGSVVLLLSIMITEPGNAISLYFTMPLFIVVLNAVIYREKPKLWALVVAIISIVGVIFIVQPSFLFLRNSVDTKMGSLGVSLALMAALCHGSHVLVVQRLSRCNTHNLYIMLSTSLQSLVVSLLLCIYFEVLRFTDSFEVAIAVTLCGAFELVGFSLLAFAATIEKPFIVAIVMTTEVVFTFTVQYITLNIPVRWQSLVGGILICTSCISIKLTEKDQGEADESDEPLLQE